MLVVTADDLGLSESVDSAILTAHRAGVVRSTSLLVTFPRAAEAAELARGERALEIGLHLDLVEGTPVSDPARVPTLLGPDGRFRGLGPLFAALVTRRVRAEEIAAEVRAQVARARALGTPALAWDSHRHVHLFPLVARVVGALGRELDARWIRRAAPPRARVGWKQASLALATVGSAPFFRGVAGNDWYVDLTSERSLPDAARVALLAALPGVGEVTAHPGTRADAGDALGARRPRDLALLTDPLLRAALGTDVVRPRVL
ncbi:MAG: ChbG/HpnK family deacetylase [Chloroflexota bacterium]|nr:ChbG/HpnK family deacetylase [Chloroflexota bacterium]MDE3193691.1 ChbG/HpnK family deacetylase [Chloroflexota bacterium]